MRKRYSLLAFDLDDTVLDDSKQLPQNMQDTLCQLALHGCLLVPSTGRVLSGIPKPVLNLPSVRYAITANGAKVHDLEEGKILRADSFDTSTALALVKELQHEKCFISVFMEDGSYTPTASLDFLNGVVPPVILDYFQHSRQFVPNIESLILNSASPVDKINVNYASDDLRQKVRAHLEQREDLSVTSSMGLNLEINTRTANKGAALAFLAQFLSLPLSEVMAAGDNDNDIQMLQTAGLGIAMNNAADSVKQAANAVCPPSSQGGLSKAIQDHFLF